MESSDFHNWQVLGYSQNWCQPLEVTLIWQPEDSYWLLQLHQLNFPNEEDAATLLSKSGISNGHLLFTASQKDLQATLDKYLFDDLFASFGIHDQARLTALSHPSGTSSGWLKAIP